MAGDGLSDSRRCPAETAVAAPRFDGPDPFKLARQLARFGTNTDGMLLVKVKQDKNALLMIMDGVTRATRVASELPCKTVSVGVVEVDPYGFGAPFGQQIATAVELSPGRYKDSIWDTEDEDPVHGINAVTE